MDRLILTKGGTVMAITGVSLGLGEISLKWVKGSSGSVGWMKVLTSRFVMLLSEFIFALSSELILFVQDVSRSKA